MNYPQFDPFQSYLPLKKTAMSGNASARSTPLGGRKVEAPTYQQWLFARDDAAKSPPKPLSPFSNHFPPPPRGPMRSNSVQDLDLKKGG